MNTYLQIIVTALIIATPTLAKAYTPEDLHYLTEAIYFEARSESVYGQLAVGTVILNRVASKRFPNTIKGVVTHTKYPGRLHLCQFSYRCDGRHERMYNIKSKIKIGTLAIIILDGYRYLGIGCSTYYHSTGVSPYWSRVFNKVSTVGKHIFYKDST